MAKNGRINRPAIMTCTILRTPTIPACTATRRRSAGRSARGTHRGLIPLTVASAAAVCALVLTVTPPITPDADVARRVTELVLNFATPAQARARCKGSPSPTIHHPACDWPLL
jgi:hypothetical protein